MHFFPSPSQVTNYTYSFLTFRWRHLALKNLNIQAMQILMEAPAIFCSRDLFHSLDQTGKSEGRTGYF